MNSDLFDTPERAETIDEVVRLLRSGSNVAVVGEPKLGKTLLLGNVARKLTSDDAFFPLLFKAVYEPVKPLGERYVLGILKALGYVVGPAVTNPFGYDYEILGELIAKARIGHPRVATLCEEILREDAILEKIRLIFLSVRKLGEILGKRVVLLVDDFSILGGYKVPGIFKAIREVLEQPGVGIFVAADTIRNFGPLILGPRTILKPNFTKVDLPPLTDRWVERLIREQYLMMIDIQPSLVAFFVDLVGGNPYYLDAIVGSIASRSIRDVSPDVVFASLNDVLLSFDGVLGLTIRNRILTSLDVRGYSTFLTLLKLLAQGKQTVSELSYGVGLSMPSLTYYLTRLIRKDFIVKRRNKYALKDRLVAYWLKNVYAVSTYGTLLASGEREAFYRAGFDAELARYVDLGRSTAYDHAVERVSRMAAFDEIRAGAIMGTSFDVIAKSGASFWLIDIVKEDLGPARVDEFRIKVAKIAEVFIVEKSIIVALSVVSAPARKYCEQRGIELWQGTE